MRSMAKERIDRGVYVIKKDNYEKVLSLLKNQKYHVGMSERNSLEIVFDREILFDLIETK